MTTPSASSSGASLSLERQAFLRALTDALSPASTLGDAAADARAILEFLEEDGARHLYLTHWLAPLWLRQKP